MTNGLTYTSSILLSLPLFLQNLLQLYRIYRQTLDVK